MKRYVIGAVFSFAALACGGSKPACDPAQQVCGATPPPPKQCQSALPGTYGVLPFKNSSKTPLELDGADTLFEAKLHDTGCFTLIERKQLDAILAEIKRCDASNPDREAMKCADWAKKGEIRGITRMISAEVTFFEPDVKGAELALKIPVLQGLDASRSYAALSFVAKLIDVETATELATATVNTVLPTDKAGLDVGSGGFRFAASVHNKTPWGESLNSMLSDTTSQLLGKLEPHETTAH